ncbi:LRR receptor-like serine/threonine-protein kinase fls2 [Datura stramonium]|uniref:LRR receptor-like serine/threonine-protein kinase fls2 n=1 Tax=Datura stramonium TaxID=4076 RepID=A0ABS8S8I7_DATST|nr:LRR receptor-like serine/threonine-protein kinase fls2 [Datura stramonium]
MASLRRLMSLDLSHNLLTGTLPRAVLASMRSTLEMERLAVKKLNHQFSAESGKCFDREVKTLSQLRHRNLVKVLGYAWESKKLKALVLEYMENGNLDSIIYGQMVDDWTLSNRIDILVSVASAGLSYTCIQAMIFQ